MFRNRSGFKPVVWTRPYYLDNGSRSVPGQWPECMTGAAVFTLPSSEFTLPLESTTLCEDKCDVTHHVSTAHESQLSAKYLPSSGHWSQGKQNYHKLAIQVLCNAIGVDNTLE